MESGSQVANEQAELWNGAAGRAWVDSQAMLDRMYKPFEDLLVDAAAAASARRVLDVGCGTGGTTLAVARSLGGGGRCTGIDISEPMIAAAHSRAARERAAASFVCADAQGYGFAPGSFDMIISRFGVMFFDDFVRAFSNLRRAAASGATLRLVVWRSAAENEFMTTAERAAAPLVPDLPARRPDGPGQFALSDERRVARILAESGWTGIDLRPLDVVCTFPEEELDRYLARLGPLGRALAAADDATRTRVVQTVRPAFAPYVHGTEVRFTAACWLVGGRA